MISVLAWRWGTRFDAVHANALLASLERNLRLEHELVVVTDDDRGLDPEIRVIPMPTRYAQTPRCRRRMEGFSREFGQQLAARVLYMDLDVVIVADLTAIVDRPEPIVGWRVGHAGVYSGSFLLADNGALDGAWQRFQAAPVAYPDSLQRNRNASDQAMLNDWLSTQPPIPHWTEADGFVTYYGQGYEKLEHLGVGPTRPHLPTGAKIVVLGSADLDVLSQARYPWVREHWLPYARVA